MSLAGLSSGDPFLIEAAKAFFAKTYQNSKIQIGQPVDKDLAWTPTLHLKAHVHLTIVAEVSEDPYPLIFNLRRTNLLNIEMPITVFSVCPEESYLRNQIDFKRLVADGFGLITVDSGGLAQRRAPAIPIIQQISTTEFNANIRGLPAKIRGRLAESFDLYNVNAISGAAHIAETIEGLVLKAGRDAAAKGWISAADAQAGPAKTLGAMQSSNQCKGAAAALGAAQAFISVYRNTSHHFPKNRKQAAKKYRDCRHGFLEGLKDVSLFRVQMQIIGLTGSLP